MSEASNITCSLGGNYASAAGSHPMVRRARSVPIETEIERRGIKLKRNGQELIGPCPRCGGNDRFGVNIAKQVFNCRGCGGGDVIEFVKHLDGVDFKTACAALAGEREYIGTPLPKPAAPIAASTVDSPIARRLWREAVPLAGTLGDRYFIEHRELDVRQLELQHGATLPTPRPGSPSQPPSPSGGRTAGASSIRLVLNRYEGRDVVDLRTWYTAEDGKLKPGKGFAAEVRHLPRLAAAFARAEATSILGSRSQ